MAYVFFDFDSTVITKETLDEAIAGALAKHPDQKKIVQEVEAITRLGMEGKLPFTESVARRLRVVPLQKKLLEATGQAMKQHITPGIPEIFAWLKESGNITYIVSGGFEECIAPVASILGVPHGRLITNRAIYSDDETLVKADERSPLWTDEGKAPALRSVRQNVGGDAVFVMVGDGMNDYRAYEAGAADVFCGFGINVRREPVASEAENFFESAHELLDFLKTTLRS